MRKAFGVAALAAGIVWSAAPAEASYVLSFVSGDGSVGGIYDYTPDELNTYTGPFYVEKAQTSWNAVHAYASTSGPLDVTADSEIHIGFTLSAPATLAVAYYYDASLSVLPNGGSSFGVNFLGPNGSFFQQAAGSYMDCPDAALHPNCLGSFSAGGIAHLDYDSGLQGIAVQLEASGYGPGGGTADAFNTAGIASIVVPDGITWTYDDQALQALNPLGFTYASVAATPEAATWAMMLAGFGGLGLARYRRSRKAMG